MRSIGATYTSLITGMAAYATAAFMSLRGVPLPSISIDVSISICLAIAFLAHLDFFSAQRRLRALSIEELLSNVVIVGVIAAIMAILPDFLPIVFNTAWQKSWITVPLPFVIWYFALLYFLTCLSNFTRLMLERTTATALQQRKWLLVLLSVAAVCQWHYLRINHIVFTIVMVLGIAVSVPLVLRLGWIAIIDRREKWLSVVYFFIINLIALAILQQLFKMHTGGSPIGFDVTTNRYFAFTQSPFVLLLLGVTSIYAVLSLLALLFALPIASAIDEQRSEVQQLQTIGKLVRQQMTIEEIFAALLPIFQTNTHSNAAWTRIPRKQTDKNKDYVCHAIDIGQGDIERLQRKINLDELESSHLKRNYDYLPDLRTPDYYDIDETYLSVLVLYVTGVGNKLEGIICLAKTFIDGYDERSIRICRAYLEQVKLSLENARLLTEMEQSTRYREELQIARTVQQALLPTAFPQLPYCEIAAIAEPAREVGGDYYDYSQIDPSRLALVVGDVSGKGTSAAFHMAQMKGIFQALMQINLPADHFLLMANQALCYCLERNRFITLSFLLFNFSNNTLSYCRAGHCPLLYYSAAQQQLSYLKSDGLGLGIVRNRQYEQHIDTREINLHVGDVLLMYTDGLTEGTDQATNTQYGTERLSQCLAQCHQLSAQQITQFIFDDYCQHTHQSPTKDDTTLVVIKINYLNKV